MSPRVCNCLECAKNSDHRCRCWLNNGAPATILNCRDWTEPEEPKSPAPRAAKGAP